MSGLEMGVLDDAFGFVMIAHLVASGTIPFLLGVNPRIAAVKAWALSFPC
jgi:hypothetical protein